MDDAPQPWRRLDTPGFERLVRSVADHAICMLDEAGVVISWNAGAERIKQYAEAEILGEHFGRFYTPEDRKTGLPAEALRIARREGHYEAEGWRVRKDGSRFWASVTLDVVLDGAGQRIGFVKLTRDIGARREAETRQRATREQQFLAQQAHALRERTAMLAHDYNNLFTAILAGAELGLRSLEAPERLTLLFDQIIAVAQRAEDLNAALKALGRDPLQAGREGAEANVAPPTPASAEAASQGGERPQPMVRPRAGPHVLVVDDDPVVAGLAHELLGALGCDAEVAHSAQQALDRLAQTEDFDLLFCDIMMPGGLSGVALGKRVRERYPNMSILLTTGYSDRLQYLSDFPMLRKPYDLAALEAAVAALTQANRQH
ncbi:response regulator [Phenylobacterium aquaticum]|uniref:response regulator n=1 Tax=Phenylobacterium aquaticum TaxID=1763816 RepID=UPI0026EF204E|nr:response regulator [Phenylobacterium aquaticum]